MRKTLTLHRHIRTYGAVPTALDVFHMYYLFFFYLPCQIIAINLHNQLHMISRIVPIVRLDRIENDANDYQTEKEGNQCWSAAAHGIFHPPSVPVA